MLRSPRAEPNAVDHFDFDQTAFLKAAYRGRVGVVRVLLADERVDVNVAAAFGDSAVHYAARFGHTEVMRALLDDVRVAVNATDSCGRSALALARSWGKAGVLALLDAHPRVER
jgi:ankyrin repeat protein